MAVAASRKSDDLNEFLEREELKRSGVYILTGLDPNNGNALAYIGEAEALATRLKDHKGEDFWSSAVVFLDAAEELTKAEIQYLEGRLIEEVKTAGRFQLKNAQASGAKLPEADRLDMEKFLAKVKQLLPVLGSDVLIPVHAAPDSVTEPTMHTEVKGLLAHGKRTPAGFIVLKGSQAVLQPPPKAAQYAPFAISKRDEYLADGGGHSWRGGKRAACLAGRRREIAKGTRIAKDLHRNLEKALWPPP